MPVYFEVEASPVASCRADPWGIFGPAPPFSAAFSGVTWRDISSAEAPGAACGGAGLLEANQQRGELLRAERRRARIHYGA
jgi:hypothetical protein